MERSRPGPAAPGGARRHRTRAAGRLRPRPRAGELGRALARPARPRRLPAGDGARRRAPHDRAPGAALPRRDQQGGRRRAAQPVPLPALVRAPPDRARARRGGDGHGGGHGGAACRRRRAPSRSGARCRGWRARCSGRSSSRPCCSRCFSRPAGASSGGPAARGATPQRSAGSASGPRGAGTPCPPSRCSPGCSPAGSRRASSCARRTPSGRPSPPGTRETDAYPLVVPLAYRWVAAAAFALAVTAVLAAVFVWVRLRRWKQMTADVAQAYGAAATKADDNARRRDRPGVGPGDAPDRRGAAGARFPAGRDRGRRAGGRRPLPVLPGQLGDRRAARHRGERRAQRVRPRAAVGGPPGLPEPRTAPDRRHRLGPRHLLAAGGAPARPAVLRGARRPGPDRAHGVPHRHRERRRGPGRGHGAAVVPLPGLGARRGGPDAGRDADERADGVPHLRVPAGPALRPVLPRLLQRHGTRPARRVPARHRRRHRC